MKIWNLHVGEPSAFLPTLKAGADRVGRAHGLSLLLSRNGHEVTHFGGHFSHVRREFEDFPANRKFASSIEGISYVLLKADRYKKNVSFARIWNHIQLAISFLHYVRSTDERPDVIVVSVPTIDLAFAATLVGKSIGARIVCDFRDLWPEIFLYHFLPERGNMVRLLSKLLPWHWMNRYVFRRSSAVVTVGDGFTQHVKNTYIPSAEFNKVRTIYQSQRGAPELAKKSDSAPFRFIWTGNIVDETDFITLKGAIKVLAQKGLEFEVWIAGRGKVLEDEKRFFEEFSSQIKVLGWLNFDQLKAAIQKCDIGLLCYLDRVDFRMAIQNKIIDYLKFGLPILGSVNGEMLAIDKVEGTSLYHLYNFGDVDSLAHEMEHLIGVGVSDIERQQCADVFEKYFSADAVERKWLEAVG